MKVQVIGDGVSAKAAKRLLLKHNFTIVERDPDLLVLSPGYSLDLEPVVKARRSGIEVIGEAELALRFMKNRAVAVTGTNGKTTAVKLIEHVLNQCGKKAIALGNIGHALSDYMCEPDNHEIAVVELSSFQIETLKTPIFEAVGITNISPDHLERYQSMEEYAGCKRQLKHFSQGPCYEGDVALPLCQHFGVTEDEFYTHVKSFKRPPHRLELIKKVDGLSFYDDSKGTNVDAACFAAKTLDGPIYLIAGGVDKGSSFAPWNEAFKGKVKKVFAIGSSAEKIKKEADLLDVELAYTMENAFGRALECANGNGTVLLSPGCSSFDQFQDYIHRGKEFQRLVRLVYES